MASLIAWLDASVEEQRRMREIIRLFADRESRDELGMSQFRDALSDILFPGTSVLLTRARYLLFVPWCLQKAAEKPDPIKEADRYERALIGAIRESDDYAGLLGLRAGVNLRTLPSVVYWTTLRHYGILADPDLSREDVLRLPGLAKSLDDPDHGGVARLHAWSASLPPPPPDFPWTAQGGFTLTREEAEWLRDRMLSGEPQTLMTHLLTDAPSPDSPAPWADAAALRAGEPAQSSLMQARAFSAAVHGAQLLYNLLIAEEYERAGLDRLSDPVDDYRARLARWATGLPALVDLDTWDLDALLRLVDRQRGAPAHPAARRFIQEWVTVMCAIGPGAVADHRDARTLVARRERQHKGAQRRIGNPARLASWSGESGAGALTYRWSNVRRILLDIHDGLAR